MVRGGASFRYHGPTVCVVFHISGFRRTQCRCVLDIGPGISCRVHVGLHLGPASWCVSGRAAECRRAAVKQQQACMFSPHVSATEESGRSWKEDSSQQTGVVAHNRMHLQFQGSQPCMTYCRQNTMHVKIAKEKRRKARVYSAGQPLPSALGNIDPCSWGSFVSALLH